jgi:hypothetical protein
MKETALKKLVVLLVVCYYDVYSIVIIKRYNIKRTEDVALVTQGYGNHIQNQIQNWPAGEPVTTTAVAAALAGVFSLDIESAKKITNVNLKRLADKGELARIQKGVYGRVRTTPFGRLTPGADEVLAGLLLHDGDKIIGYIAGPTLLNALGLCSWMPRERHIATNNYRRRLPAGTPIRVYKPPVNVDNENAPYLQMIEAFEVMERYPVDADHPDEILRGMLRNRQMNNEKLIWYARKHYGRKTLLTAIDIALGGTAR